MTETIGTLMLVGVCLWILWDPTVLAELVHAFWCSCLDLDPEEGRRDHEQAMDALDRARSDR